METMWVNILAREPVSISSDGEITAIGEDFNAEMVISMALFASSNNGTFTST